MELFGLGTDKLIVFRSMLACLIAFLLSLFLIPVWIFVQKMKSISENVEKKYHAGLDDKLSSKKDTPTMGGIFIYITSLGGLVLVSRISHEPVLTILSLFSIFLLIGLGDDLSKFFRVGKGLSLISKSVIQICGILFSSLVIYRYVLSYGGGVGTTLYLPFIGTLNLGFLYVIFIAMSLFVFTNGVNFADGLDGLAAGTFLITLFGLMAVTYITGRVDFSRYLEITYIPNAGSLTIFLSSLFGALIGFLWFNFNPSQVFMGDCGSLALGCVLVSVVAMTKTEFMMVGLGLIYIAEFLSSFVQVLSFKLFKKRPLLIAPFHYIPYLKGVHENKVTLRIIMIHFLLCLSSLFLLKIK
ncbi:MAG: phospho-N-acetylmuramoyl-pentapeptide-transferase [Planctomycetes bacterium]|nr:phospho-N-acetylmuramoyl-pentapeptide-transferase [Planctomycetota bacterium]